jgi:hypothetical protein
LRPGTVQLTSRLSVVFAVAATEGAAGVSGRSATSVSVIATPGVAATEGAAGRAGCSFTSVTVIVTAIDTVAVPSVTLTCTA